MVNESFETVIKSFLDKRSEEDSLFAKAYAKAGKTIKECCNYIVCQARKMQQNGCAVIADDIVYGWAVHYYDEDNVEVDVEDEDSEQVEVRVSEQTAPVVSQQPVIKAVKKKRQDDNMLQLSLFGEL